MVFPPGRYVSGTIHLRSGVTLHLEAGAWLIGTTNLAHYAQPTPPAFMPEAEWGKWHRGFIVGENVEDVAITGSGTIDGNKVFDPTGEERMRGPHTIIFVNCRRFTLRDVTIVDAANYAIFFQVSDDVEIRILVLDLARFSRTRTRTRRKPEYWFLPPPLLLHLQERAREVYT